MITRVIRLGLILMVVGLVAALGLGLTYAVTKDRIEEQSRIEETEACVEALPSVEDAGELEEDMELTSEVRRRIPDVEKVYVCGEGVIIILKVKGYGGPIRMAVGIGDDGLVRGLSVISHNETPGLGGNIENREFLDQFDGKTINDPIVVGEDIQAITGATITSKAAAKEVREALKAFEEIRSSG